MSNNELLVGYLAGAFLTMLVISVCADEDEDAGALSFLAVVWPATVFLGLAAAAFAAPFCLGRAIRKLFL